MHDTWNVMRVMIIEGYMSNAWELLLIVIARLNNPCSDILTSTNISELDLAELKRCFDTDSYLVLSWLFIMYECERQKSSSSESEIGQTNS